MNRVRTKICGITSIEDGQAAVTAGADAIGLVFHAGSPRAVSIEQAAPIATCLAPLVTRVALFMDRDADYVRRVLDQVDIDLLQFHGSESPAFCRQFGRAYMKAVPMGEPDVDLAQWSRDFADARALLLDAHRAGEAGGTGQRFAWTGDMNVAALPLMIAGGLTPDNVAAAITRFAPYAVDVSSGVESAPGIKDSAKMCAFVDAALKTPYSRLVARNLHE